jgi:hypothetical protein
VLPCAKDDPPCDRPVGAGCALRLSKSKPIHIVKRTGGAALGPVGCSAAQQFIQGLFRSVAQFRNVIWVMQTYLTTLTEGGVKSKQPICGRGSSSRAPAVDGAWRIGLGTAGWGAGSVGRKNHSASRRTEVLSEPPVAMLVFLSRTAGTWVVASDPARE